MVRNKLFVIYFGLTNFFHFAVILPVGPSKNASADKQEGDILQTLETASDAESGDGIISQAEVSSTSISIPVQAPINIDIADDDSDTESSPIKSQTRPSLKSNLSIGGVKTLEQIRMDKIFNQSEHETVNSIVRRSPARTPVEVPKPKLPLSSGKRPKLKRPGSKLDPKKARLEETPVSVLSSQVSISSHNELASRTELNSSFDTKVTTTVPHGNPIASDEDELNAILDGDVDLDSDAEHDEDLLDEINQVINS